jgi:ELWxxDGT repeat protein
VYGVAAAGEWVYGFGSFFSPYLGTSVNAAWATNGRPDGGRIIALDPSYEFTLPSADGRLYFGGSSGVWITDGTRAGTIQLASGTIPDMWTQGRDQQVAVVGSRIFFAQSGHFASDGNSLWVSDGTPDSTRLVRSFPTATGRFGGYLQRCGSGVFFYASGGSGYEPWFSDGTPEGTQQLKDIYPGSNSSELKHTVDFVTRYTLGDAVYFQASDGVHLNSLWVTDGTPAGTRFVKDSPPARRSSTRTLR